MFNWFEQQKAFYNTIGPLRFAGIYLALLAYVGLFVWLLMWLSDETGWPEAYGSRCHGRGCWPTYLWHSFGLLKVGSAYEIGLFGLLWHMPVLAGAFVTVVVLRRKLRSRRNRIRPMDDD